MTALAGRFNREIVSDAFDPGQMTMVGPLCGWVAEQRNEK
jgi:hypothetical protein